MVKLNEKKSSKDIGFSGLGGFVSGLGTLIEKLGELAEKGEELRKSGEFEVPGTEGKMKGVYGFSVRTGIGGEEMKVEPFGNLHADKATGKAVVQEEREPLVDIFDEKNHVLVVIEMPGISEEDLHLKLEEDCLTVTAKKRDKKYHKEIELPETFSPDQMSHTCRNGIVEVKFMKK
jgi:HSP20 family protein